MKSSFVQFVVRGLVFHLPHLIFVGLRMVALSTFVTFAFKAAAQVPVNLGTFVVTNIGHYYTNPMNGGAALVSDTFIDQEGVSHGGERITPIWADLDTNVQLSVTVMAPPGKRFLVHASSSSRVTFGGKLHWTAVDGTSTYNTGSVSALFTGLIGQPPTWRGAGGVAQNHAALQLDRLLSSTMFSDFSFASVTLTSVVTNQDNGSGLMEYDPSSSQESDFYVMYSGPPTDPGRFSEIVDAPSATTSRSSSGLTLTWPAAFSNWVLEVSSAINSGWTQFQGSPVLIGTNWAVVDSTSEAQRFYRLRAN